MIYSVDEFVSDARLAFIQGKYDESLKLAKQALEKKKRVQMLTNVPETRICLLEIMNQQ